MRIDQVLVSAAPGDAITTAALDLQSALRGTASSGVYARYIHPALEDRFEFLEAMADPSRPGAPRDVVVYHASIGEAPVFEFVRDRPERLVVEYHNVSPADAFRQYDEVFARRLEAGRREISALAGRAVLALANSAYSASELTAMGYRDVRVAPLLPDWRRLLETPVPPEVGWRVAAAASGPVALFVGQLLPHKRPELLVQAFHALTTYLRPDATLVLVGASRLARYAEVLHAAVAELNLAHQVVMAGAVDDAELSAWYRRADLFVTASEHEGLCVPLIEAMAFERPVVARAFAAIPETLGGAGLLLPADGSVLLLAEAVNALFEDRRTADELVRRGRDRVVAFDPAAALASFRDLLVEAAA